LKKIFVKLFGAKHNNWTKNAQLSEKENPWNRVMTKTAFLTDNWAKIFYKRF
jgi:hypothetical protein